MSESLAHMNPILSTLHTAADCDMWQRAEHKMSQAEAMSSQDGEVEVADGNNV